MTLGLTTMARFASQSLNFRPLIVVTFEDVPTAYGSGEISEPIRIGDTGLEIDNYNGDAWYIGGNRPLVNQGTLIMLGPQGGRTTTVLSQQLDPDKGIGSSVTNFIVSLLDKAQAATRLISPGVVVPEILGRKCKVEVGFVDLAYPKDFVTVFRGIVEGTDPNPASVDFSMSAREQQKRQTVFNRVQGILDGALSNVGAITTITLEDASAFPVPVLGPDGTYDSSISFYVQIGDEYFRYTGVSGNQLTGVTRNPSPFNFGQTTHDDGDPVNLMVRLEGNGLDLARKVMLSGKNGYYKTGVAATNFRQITPTEFVDNAIYFQGVNVNEAYGVYPGDFITTASATNGANNVTLKEILEVVQVEDGSYIVVDDVTFVTEVGTPVAISLRSKWDTLGIGCAMSSDDVDLAEFDRIYRLFLSSFPMDFRLKDGVEGKTFIEDQLLRPMAAFSIPRKGRVSIGYHIGPLPGSEIPKLDISNVLNANQLRPKRSISKNYYNTIKYEIDQNVNEQSKYEAVFEFGDQTSKDRFKTGVRQISFKSDGMRTELQGETNGDRSATRFLNRYKSAAEYIEGVQVNFSVGFPLEIGDLVIVDYTSLKMSDIRTGTREGDSRLMQIINKKTDYTTGISTLSLIDTNFDLTTRYCLISPASLIRSATSAQVFSIKESFESVYGANEYLKWVRFGQIYVTVRSPDGVTRNAIRRISSIAGNTVTLDSALPFTPQPDDLMHFAPYDYATDQQKLIYAFMRDTAPFGDGTELYQML